MNRYSFAIAVLLFASPAMATDMYKCTQPDGSMTFSDKPCGESSEKITVEGQAMNITPAEAARRAAVGEAIMLNKVMTGMTASEVRRSWGSPDDINTTVTSGSRSEQWVYDRGPGRSQYVYFRDGAVTSISSN